MADSSNLEDGGKLLDKFYVYELSNRRTFNLAELSNWMTFNLAELSTG